MKPITISFLGRQVTLWRPRPSTGWKPGASPRWSLAITPNPLPEQASTFPVGIHFLRTQGSGRQQPVSLSRVRFMRTLATLVTLSALAMGGGAALAAPLPSQNVTTNRMLRIDPCTSPVAAGKATLTIGVLQRTNGIYRGDYKLKVFPYFYKNDAGRLAIVVPDEVQADVKRGKTVAVMGTATTSASSGRTRQIVATAKPAGPNRGALTLSFQAGDRKMVFNSTYHFDEPGTPGAHPAIPTAKLSATR